MTPRSTSLCLFIAIIAIYFTYVDARKITSHESSWAVEIPGGRYRADRIARQYGFRNLGQVEGLDDVYHFVLRDEATRRNNRGGVSISQRLLKDKNVKFFEKQVLQEVALRYYKTPDDPYFSHQWNLLNTGQQGPEYVGNDLKVEQAWLQGLTGCNVTVTIVDNGIDYKHPDLWPNFAPSVSFDHLGNDTDPSSYQFRHGTHSSGVVAAAQDDKTCGVGVAHECNLGSLKLLGNNRGITDLRVADALSHAREVVDIYSNSWGPTDNGSAVGGPGILTSRVLQKGTDLGRGGKGSIFVWANGNGGEFGDDCGADGYASSIYTISVGAIGIDNRFSSYDEICSAKMVVTYVTVPHGNREIEAIVTTDTGGGCINTFGGTSAAAPMAAGVIALALEANPDLTWRDVQYLIVYTANPDLTTGNKTRNGGGLVVSRQYGFGVIDAEAMVSRARHWVNVPPQIEEHATDVFWEQTLDAPFTTEANYTGSIRYMEHMVVRIDVEIPHNSHGVSRGDLEIELKSPSGTKSVLLHPRMYDKSPGKYPDWPFMSVMFWGEDPRGQWTLTVKTGDVVGVANISNVSFVFYGVSGIPESVRNIPERCHSDCKRGCAGNSSDKCDSCKQLRDAHTRRCINSTQCPEGYTERSGYCYDPTIPYEECYAPLKNKDATDFDPNYNNITCQDIGYTECCTNGDCSPFHPIKCFCDEHCFKFNDCCEDASTIGCTEQDKEGFGYITLEETPGIETNVIERTEFSSPINASFPYVASVEPRIYVSRNGYFRFASDDSQEGRDVMPFYSVNDPDIGSVKYEVHERDDTSRQTWSKVHTILSEHGYSDFEGKWLLVTIWSGVAVPDMDGNYTNSFQGMLVTDYLKSYAIFTYNCGDMTVSYPGLIGYHYSDIDLYVEHGASFRERPHYISCYNEPRSLAVNVVYEIATSVNQCEMDNAGCEQNCTDTFLSFYCTCEPGYVLNDDGLSCSGEINSRCECNEISLLELKGPIFEVPREDDGLSDPIRSSNCFPFGNGCKSTIYVGTNGYFTFNSFSGFTPFPFTHGTGLSIVAPFFTDIDISKGQIGSIGYQVHTNLTNPFSREVVGIVNAIVRDYVSGNFSAQWVLVAKWDQVTPYGKYDRTFTFEGILATDFTRSFAIFLYECDGRITSITNRATIGYISNDGDFENHDVTFQTNPFLALCANSRSTKIIRYDISGCNREQRGSSCLQKKRSDY